MTGTGERPAHRVMPRTSSIDSAISSLSSASQGSPFDANSLSSTEINKLITAAGSAETVIVHLLKDKHQTNSQNLQLWKLVRKQRTLILGLNRDLESMNSEKEKYQEKIKSLQEASQRAVGAAEISDHVEKGSQAPSQPSIAAFSDASRGDFNETASPVSPTEIPSSPIGESKSGFANSGRRGRPPARLHLSSPADNTVVPVISSSDYDDEENEIPNLDRGRRKTREQDDQDRETALQREVLAYAPQTNISSLQSPGLASRENALSHNSRSRHTVDLSSNEHSVDAMPLTPGLPLSPRPEDRPLGSPLPRMPRDLSSGSRISNTGFNPTGFAPAFSNGRPGGSVSSSNPRFTIDYSRTPYYPDVVHRTLKSDDYPDLPLSPNALPRIQVKVSSSRLRHSRGSHLGTKQDDELVFTLSVISRHDKSELWRVEKSTGSLPLLDQKIRQTVSLPLNVNVPDKNLFNGHSPAKIDLRRAALNAYFDSLLDSQVDEKAALVICEFLNNDAVQPGNDETNVPKGLPPGKPGLSRGPDGKPRKEGYLTKRGKSFGGWKERYFVLDGPELKYYEFPSGQHMGTIKLCQAQIGKQSPKSAEHSASPSGGEDDTDNQYRHAFLILEPKKKDSSALVRHVLCSESDDERDSWVDALMEHVEGASSENEPPENVSSKGQPQAQESQKKQISADIKAGMLSSGGKRPGPGAGPHDQDQGNFVQGFNFDDAIRADPPTIGSTLEYAPRSPRSPRFPERESTLPDGDQPLQSPRLISGPTNGTIIQDGEAWGNKNKTSTREKKRSIWGFRTRSSLDLANQGQASTDAPVTVNIEKPSPARPVFGIPLKEAVEDCAPLDVDVKLPAVVYRCIEYLRAKAAVLEEGIFRLSGSNLVIKSLKERFNNEGDVDLVSGDQYYDVHAVASLFKQYLRELPTTVLTRELHLDFLRVLELDDRKKKVVIFNTLVHKLPEPNFELLRAISAFLIEVVSESDTNKMNVRNVGIVFAPTLNIPAPVFSMFLKDFDSIFDSIFDNQPSERNELPLDRSLSPGDIRSPRHQTFSDVSTPSYQQTSFQDPGTSSDSTRMSNNTGFMPMQPSYDHNKPRGPSGPYSSLNGMLLPNSSDDTRSAKTKRRESSMLFMDGAI